MIATATPEYKSTNATADGLCIECQIPVVWVDGVTTCANGSCPMGDANVLSPDTECDWPHCTKVVFHINTRRKTQRCHEHKSHPAWPDGQPRVEIPGQGSLMLSLIHISEPTRPY